jgi:hypothetical protein
MIFHPFLHIIQTRYLIFSDYTNEFSYTPHSLQIFDRDSLIEVRIIKIARLLPLRCFYQLEKGFADS